MAPLAPAFAPRVLVLGCGIIRREGAIHVDANADVKPEVVHDLNAYPWPFEEGSFTEVVAEHVLEHLREPARALQEIHRVGAPGAVVHIVTPHYSSPESWNDLTHMYHFGVGALKPFYKGSYGTRKLFNLAQRRLRFGKGVFGWPGWLISKLSLDFYEKYFCFLFPARNIEIRLQVAKDGPPSKVY